MHHGSIDRDTKAGQVFALLLERLGGEWDAWSLAQAARTTCVSTHVCDVKQQLEVRPELSLRIEHERRGNDHYYRLVRTGQQELWSGT